MAATVFILFLNLLLISKTTYATPMHLDRVLEAVEKLIEYYKKSYRDMNVDGLFGLRVVEGHLLDLINKHENGTLQAIDPKVIAKLKSMQTESAKTSSDALYYVKKDDEVYFRSMQFIIGNPWALQKSYKELQFQLVWDPSIYKQTSAVNLDEKESDKCMMEIMGYQPSKTKCDISDKCVNMMTRKGLTGYGITHQLLWTMLSEQAGCLTGLSDKLVGSGKGIPENMQLEFCTNNYVEVMQVVHGTLKGQVIPLFQDLFLEQQFVCPSLGFYQFLSDEFLTQILSWQRDVGCFGIMNKTTDKPPEFLNQFVENYDYKEDENHQDDAALRFSEGVPAGQTAVNIKPPQLNLIHESKMKNLANVPMTNSVVIQRGADLVTQGSDKGVPLLGRNRNYSINPNAVLRGQRRLLSEKEMKDGCLAHKTAVAAGALIAYLRYLILPGPKTLAENTQEMLKQRRLLHVNENAAEKFFPGAKIEKPVPEVHLKGHAMNNNILAAQINNNDKDDDYYEKDENEDEDKDDEEEENDGGNKNVQFDYRDNNNKGDNSYDEYEDRKTHQRHVDVKNLADNKDKGVPKADDTDYTYYEDKNKHDDYTNEEYEEKEQNANKNIKSSSDKIKVKLINESKNEEDFSQSKMQSPSGIFFIISCTIFVLLFFMYRFLKKRRVHIRYNYKSFNRV